jgi:hypothetical protein
MQKDKGLSVDQYSHTSRLVKNDVKLKRVFTVAGTELSSNCDILVGPLGSWTALPFDTHEEISSDVSCGRINPRHTKLILGWADQGVLYEGILDKTLAIWSPKKSMQFTPGIFNRPTGQIQTTLFLTETAG